jgi:hypothetical protein
MPTDNITFALTQLSSTPSASFRKDSTITSNSVVRCGFKMTADKEILVIPVRALRAGLKYIGVTSDVALTGALLRDSTETGTTAGSGTVIDLGTFTAGQTKQSGSVDNGGADIDFALPGSGNDINNLRITKTVQNEATVTVEMYFSETIVESD